MANHSFEGKVSMINRMAIDTDYNKVFKRADEAMYRDKAEYYKTHDRRRG